MSETLRDLVVRLSLNSDNFTRNIKSINKQIQEAQSTFQMAAAGVENFENTTAGLASKLNMLDRTLSLQQDALLQYYKALEQANAKLQECYDRQNDYAQRLVDAQNKQQQLKEEVRRAAEAYRNYARTLGESDSATIAAKANLDALKGEYRESVQQVKLLRGQNVALTKATQNAADAVSTAQARYNLASGAVAETTAEIERCRSALDLSMTSWDAAGDEIKRAEQAITSIGKQMKQAESRFKLAAAGVKEFDKSAEGLSAKLTLLNEKQQLQTQAVEEYERKLEAAKEQLRAAQSVNDPDKIRQATDAVTDAETALNNAKAELKQTRAEIENTNKELKTAQSAWTSAGKSMESFGKKCDKVGQSMSKAGQLLSTTVTTPIVALGATAVKASLDFESSFASVRKTVDATEQEFDALAATSKRMSTEIATSTSEINEVMATGGQLGIANEYLESFTRTMIDLGNSCEDLDASEAASTIAKFANIMGTNQGLFQNIGSTIVALGNNFATTEKPIMEMAQRLAGAGKQVGLTEAQILGFATAFSSVGIEAEMGGSAFSKALIKMEVACATGGEALDDFAMVCGMSAEQFKYLFEVDPAAAFQAFILSLAQMDEEGMSAIAVLDEIGIAEVRLRDTMLRAVNATDLFAETQAVANAAWNENNALTEEANKRYATTASRLTNLKNKALLFAQQLGDDLNPTIQSLIDSADELLDSFLQMDESQRQQIIQMAAYAAAAGPVILTLGKITTGVGKAVTGIGKFATAVGAAGGGFKGFMAVLGKSPAVWLAVAAAVVVGTVALADYISGAKEAREALEGMNETAEKWKDTTAETFYGNSEGLSFFGMSKEDFTRDKGNAEEWLAGLIAVWTDGQKESDEIVTQWTESFKALTGSTREALLELKNTADDGGYTSVSEGLAADLEQLDAIDAEIERLLKRRQNGYFSEADQIRLQELIDTREAIEIKYHLTEADTDGFETIGKKIEAEVARAQARGLADADVTVYENALVAAAEGMAAINAEIDTQYDKEYAVIQLIEDSAERQTAMDELNSSYMEKRRAAALEYAQTMARIVTPVWEQENIQQAKTDIDELVQLLRQYQLAQPESRPAILTQMEELSAAMDEGAMTEYLALLTQIQSLMDSGMSESEIQAMFPEIDFSAALEQIASIQTFLNNRELELPGLTSMFGEALPEEVLKIATDLDMTGAQARWNEFAANPGAITTDAIIATISENEATVKVQPQVDAFIAKYTEIPEGADTSSLTPTGLLAYVTTYAEATTGVDVSGLNPTNVTAIVSGYEELASGVDTSTLKPDEITAYIMQYLEAEGVDTTGLNPQNITATVMAYEEATGGALTTALTPSDVTAMVVRYLEADGVDISALGPDQIEAIVTSFAEATNCDKSQLLKDFTVYIARYDDTNAALPSLEGKIGIYGYDLLAYRQFVQDNPIEIAGILKLSEVYEDPTAALGDAATKYWKDGVEIPATMVTEDMLTADRVAVLGQDGTMHILITPEVTGTQEAIDAIQPLVDELDRTGFTELGHAITGTVSKTVMDMIDESIERVDYYGRVKDYNDWDKFWADAWAAMQNGFGGATYKTSNVTGLENNLPTGDMLAELSVYVSEFVAAVRNGAEVAQDDLDNIQQLVTLLNGLDAHGIGTTFRESIGVAMTEAGWESDAETVAENLEAALERATNRIDFTSAIKGKIEYANVLIGEYEDDLDEAQRMTSAELQRLAESGNPLMDKTALENALDANFNEDYVAQLTDYVSGIVSAIRQGEAVSEADLENLKQIVEFLSALDTYDVGTNILEGVGVGMTEAGWDSNAETVAANLEAALNMALGIQSPSTRVKPVGDNVAAGVGVGMAEHDFTADASTVATNLVAALDSTLTSTLLAGTATTTMGGLASGMTAYSFVTTGSTVSAGVKSALSASLNSTTLRSVGVNAMAGLKAGINAGKSGVISAMRSAASAAVSAAKSQLKIASPSGVFRDEIGVMTMRGFGEGVLEESKRQQKIIRNASRYLADSAKEGSIAYSNNDNRKTYNTNQSVNLTVQSMQIRDEQDIRSLAVEIATLTRRQQRGRGLRFA